MDIAVDFDGTCVSHEFPNVGKDIGAAPVLRELVKNGHNIILFTMRSDNGDLVLFTKHGAKQTSGNFLQDAVKWFQTNGIELYGININPTQSSWTKSPKTYAQLYIDDAALGVPLKTSLKISERPFVDWLAVRKLLINKGIIKNA